MSLPPSTCKCNSCMVKSSWPGEKLYTIKIIEKCSRPKKLTFSILDLNSFRITFSQFLSVFFNEVWYYFLEKTYIHAPFVLSLLSHPHTLCHVIFNACLRSFHTKYLMHISVCFIFAPPKPKFNVNTILFEIILCLMI